MDEISGQKSLRLLEVLKTKSLNISLTLLRFTLDQPTVKFNQETINAVLPGCMISYLISSHYNIIPKSVHATRYLGSKIWPVQLATIFTLVHKSSPGYARLGYVNISWNSYPSKVTHKHTNAATVMTVPLIDHSHSGNSMSKHSHTGTCRIWPRPWSRPQTPPPFAGGARGLGTHVGGALLLEILSKRATDFEQAASSKYSSVCGR